MTKGGQHRLHVTATQLTDELSSSLVRRSSRLFELTKAIVLIAVTVMTTNSLAVTVAVVDGPSMEPTYQTNDLVLVNRLARPQRGDVVILKYPGDPTHHRYIKRIVASPGDQVAIRGGQVIVNGDVLAESYLAAGITTIPNVAERTLGAHEYYTLGDNRPVSNDSRFFGAVEGRYVVGTVRTILYRGR